MIANKQVLPVMETIKKPPMSIEAELAAIGAILQNGKTHQLVREALDIITPEMFYLSTHQTIMRTITKMDEVDPMLVADELERIGVIPQEIQFADLMDIARSAHTTANLLAYAKTIKERYNLRASIEIYNNAIEQAYASENSQEIITQLIEQLAKIESAATYEPKHISAKIDDWINIMERRCTNDESAIGVKTGIHALDDQITGIGSNWLVVLAGRPSMGKTLVAQLIQSHIAKRGETLFFSMEMSSDEIMDRYVGLLAGISPKDLRMGALSEDQWPKVHALIDHMRSNRLKLHYDETAGLSVEQICARAKAAKKRYPNLAIITIDYLGLMQMPKAERDDIALGMITRRLKQLAKEINTPILLLAQANRGTDSAKRPQMQNLKGSSAIEADADLVLFVHRDEVANPESVWKGTTEIIPAKFRHGSIEHDVYLTKTENGFRCLTSDEIQDRENRESKPASRGFDL